MYFSFAVFNKRVFPIEFDCVPPNFDKFYGAANEKYMSYLEGEFDSGFYM